MTHDEFYQKMGIGEKKPAETGDEPKRRGRKPAESAAETPETAEPTAETEN